ncbi:hypothetical protein QQ054_03735 [Oscillatoria amoena NRMC-F 0135]|nr:hypothetical protein [Oscillatoria amoena NRMC-F 0135]
MAKLYFLLLLLTLLLLACQKKDVEPIPAKTLGCTEIMEQTHTLSLLAMQLVFETVTTDTSHPDYNNVLLPAKLLDKTTDDLTAISQLNDKESDTVFNMAQIHKYFRNDVLRMLTVEAPKTPCTDKLRYYSITHQCSPIDSLLAKYNFSTHKVSTEPYPPGTGDIKYTFTFSACLPLNTVAMAKKLKQTGLVYSAVPLPQFGRTNLQVFVERTATHTLYTFGYGWDDCPSGCMSWRFWKFSVSAMGKATFIESWGDDNPLFL